MENPIENWRDMCRLASAAAEVRGDEESSRCLKSLTTLSDDQVLGVCMIINSKPPS